MRIIITLIFAIFASHPAQATPPQVISVDESLISVNGFGDFIFVLRESKDNMGSHTRLQTDTVLIARSKETNRDVYLWPISRTLDNGPEHVETEGNPRLVTMPMDVEYNPWHVTYIHHGGLPNQLKATVESAIEVLGNMDGALISAKTPHFAYGPPEGTPPRTSYWVNYAKLTGLIEQSLANARYRFRPFYLEDKDPLIQPGFSFKQDCKFDYFAELSEQTDGEQQAFWATKITCENDATMAPVSMFITLQALP
ncbi:hypothetical protein [Profundibacter sp.]